MRQKFGRHEDELRSREGTDLKVAAIDSGRMSTMHLMSHVRTLRPRRVSRWSAALVPAVLIALVALVYHAWLEPGLITAGDFPYFSSESLKGGLGLPSLWDLTSSTGAFNILGAPLYPIGVLQGIMANAHIGWTVSERILWIFPAVLLPCIATYVLSVALFRCRLAAFISALAAVMNSYVYLLYEGGQFGVAMAYGCMPLVLWAFIRGQRRGTLTSFLLTGILLSLQVVYDIRSTYISLGLLLLYGLVCCAEVLRRRGAGGVRTWLRTLGLPQIVVALMVVATVHAWWTLPALVFRAPALPPGYGNVVGVRALSLMHLSNGLSLFHPFWFDNNQHLAPINPLFFVVPLLVFGLMLRHRSDMLVMFLLTAALIAAFLVKGDNEPGGDIYDWLFVHLPGFFLFRDASKFYQPLAVAYALLLGVAALELGRIVRPLWRLHHVGTAIVAIIFVGVAAFPAYPALLQQGRGTFAINPMPADYARFNALVDRQRAFFRVLWVPARPRFGAFSGNHPALDAAQIGACCIRVLSQANRPWSWMSSPSVVWMLQALSVRYIVVPDAATSDFMGQAWWTPGSDGSPAAILTALRRFLPSLRESVIGHLHVFVNPAAYPMLFTVSGSSHVQRGAGCAIGALCVNASSAVAQLRAVRQSAGDSIISVTDRGSWYDVRVRAGGHPVYLILQQTYDPHWQAFVEPHGPAIWPWATLMQRSLPRSAHVVANGYANAWRLQEPGTVHVVLEYWPRRLALLGWLVTMMSLLLYLGIALLRIWPRGRRPLFYCVRLPALRTGQRCTAELRGNRVWIRR